MQYYKPRSGSVACLCVLCMQESSVSKAVKSVVTLSTILLCCLIVIYHAIEVQVRALNIYILVLAATCSQLTISDATIF